MKHTSFRWRFGKTRGALLVEVMISLVIFTIGMVAAFSLLIHSIRINSLSKNRVIAVNLAREALEVVKNVRDTNWLVYSANIRECWNYSPDDNENGDMTDNTACTPGGSGNKQNTHPMGLLADGITKVRTFIVDFDSNNTRWMMLPAAKRLDTSVPPQIFTEYTAAKPNGEARSDSGGEINPSNYSTMGGEERNVELGISSDGRYTHHTADWQQTSPFLRVIDICYLDNLGSGDCDSDGLIPYNDDPPNDPATDNRIKVIAKVYWKENASDETFKSVIVETVLTDYLNRTNWLD